MELFQTPGTFRDLAPHPPSKRPSNGDVIDQIESDLGGYPITVKFQGDTMFVNFIPSLTKQINILRKSLQPRDLVCVLIDTNNRITKTELEIHRMPNHIFFFTSHCVEKPSVASIKQMVMSSQLNISLMAQCIPAKEFHESLKDDDYVYTTSLCTDKLGFTSLTMLMGDTYKQQLFHTRDANGPIYTFVLSDEIMGHVSDTLSVSPYPKFAKVVAEEMKCTRAHADALILSSLSFTDNHTVHSVHANSIQLCLLHEQLTQTKVFCLQF